MTTAVEMDALEQLSARLTDPQDRQRYAELISYFRQLPPGDELFRLAQLFGFLALLSEKAPEALQQFLSALEQQAETATAYHRKLDERLARLPDEIAEGVDPEEIADAMSERFRQQLAKTGLQDSAKLLGVAAAALTKLSGQLAETVKPLANQYASIGTTVARELTKLTDASSQLRQYNALLATQAAEERWLWKTLFGVMLLLAGFILGLSLEKRRTTDAIYGLQEQTAQILQKATTQPLPIPSTVLPRAKKNIPIR